jgi:hypothetical protein
MNGKVARSFINFDFLLLSNENDYVFCYESFISVDLTCLQGNSVSEVPSGCFLKITEMKNYKVILVFGFSIKVGIFRQPTLYLLF